MTEPGGPNPGGSHTAFVGPINHRADTGGLFLLPKLAPALALTGATYTLHHVDAACSFLLLFLGSWLGFVNCRAGVG